MATETAPAPTTLVKKLAAVMKAVERVPKRGRNEFHKYDYATEADIVATVRQELADRDVMLIPAILGETRTSVGEKGSVLTTLEMQMEFLDGESGESIVKPWRGYGTDKEDKGGYKAMTGGEKHFLLKTFLMPTGDDPEAEDEKRDRKPPQQPRERRSPTPAPPAAEPPKTPPAASGSAPAPPPRQADKLQASGVVITDVVFVPEAGGAAEHWVVTTGTHGEFKTQDEQLAKVAEECAGAGEAMTLSWRLANGRRGVVRVLQSIDPERDVL